MHCFLRAEKAVAGGLAGLSALLLASIVVLFVMEIFLRYAMGAPTKWSNDTVSFIMPIMIFLALPEVARRGQHIAITFLLDALGRRATAFWSRFLAATSGAVSLGVFWIITITTVKQFNGGILTNTVIQVPKWMLLAPLAGSFLAMAAIFFATACGAERDH